MELKFRAWHIERGEEYNDAFAITESGTMVILEQRRYDYAPVYEFTDDYIIEQYTGLKDKNGNEVYVGDIVKIIFVFGIFEITKVRSIFDFAQWNWDNISTVEVIGNIHENKELLK